MPPLGYALVFIGVLLARQVMVGRASNTVEDLRDVSLAFLNGDIGSVSDVFSRRGGGGSSGVAGSPSYPSFEGGGTGSPYGVQVMQRAVQLGEKAKGYVWGATGPDYYDCSGLIWRAMKETGVYSGLRFTTGDFEFVMVTRVEEVIPGQTTSVGSAHSVAGGDIVVWRGKHMGVATGPDSYYSARSPSKGIGGASITGDAGYFGDAPQIFRIIKAG